MRRHQERVLDDDDPRHGIDALGLEPRQQTGKVPDADLARRSPGKAYSLGFAIRGIAAHDLYHAGQVQLLKRLYKDSRLRASGLLYLYESSRFVAVITARSPKPEVRSP